MDVMSLEFHEAVAPVRRKRKMWQRSSVVPVRRVVQQRPKIVCGYHQCWKTREKVGFEYGVERDYALILDCDPTVEEFYSQPIEVRYRLNEPKSHTYTPDFVAYLLTGRVYIEVKPAKPRPDEPDLPSIARLFASYGERLIVVREPQVRSQPRFANAQLCHPYALETVSADFRSHIRQMLSPVRDVRCVDLFTSRSPSARATEWPQILGMICRGELHYRRNTYLSEYSEVSNKPYVGT